MTRIRILALSVTAALAGTLLMPTSAGAKQPSKEAFSFAEVNDFPAGTTCDFAYHRELSISGTHLAFVDQEGNVVREMEITAAQVLHQNSDTGYTLTETLHGMSSFNETRETLRVVGLNWHLRDPEGKIVVVHAGQILIDLERGELVKATPNFAPEFPDVLCPALGGSPA